MPTHSPGCTLSVSPPTASTSPAAVANVTPRSSISSTGAPSPLTGVERIAQRVAEQIERDEQHHEKARRCYQHPGRRLDVPRALVDQTPEARVRLLHPEPEEAEETLVQNHLGNRQRR